MQPDGETLSYAPNALGQATQATSGYANYATNVSYYPNGALAGFTYGNGITHTLTQNARFLPDRSKDQYAGSTAVLDDSYVYDANGNVAAIVDGLPGAPTSRTMTYDDLDRLKKVVSPLYGAVGANYTYDALDNLKHITIISGGVYRDHLYCYDAAWHLTNLKTTSCSTGASVVGLGYDPQGNVVNKNGQGYVFDIGNRLRAATGKETYQYDGNGRRVLAQVAGAGNLVSMYGQDGVLRYQRDARTTRDLNYVYLAGSLVAVRDSLYAPTLTHRFRYQHTDALGTPVAVTDESRNVVERNTYEPYGARIGGVVANGVGYTGHVMDKETGLTYMQQRYYDPAVGSFLSMDPVAADTVTGWNFNRFNYAADNPYKFKDPDGRIIETAWDAFNVGLGVASFVENAKEGRWGAAALDGVGIIADTAATAIPVLPGGAGTAIRVSRAAERMAEVARLGRQGERAAEIVKNTVRIPSATGTAAYRIPDGLTKTTLTEVKNYSGTLRLTNQLKDFMAYAKSSNRTFELIVGPNTKLSPELERLRDAGDIIVKNLKK